MAQLRAVDSLLQVAQLRAVDSLRPQAVDSLLQVAQLWAVDSLLQVAQLQAMDSLQAVDSSQAVDSADFPQAVGPVDSFQAVDSLQAVDSFVIQQHSLSELAAEYPQKTTNPLPCAFLRRCSLVMKLLCSFVECLRVQINASLDSLPITHSVSFTYISLPSNRINLRLPFCLSLKHFF